MTAPSDPTGGLEPIRQIAHQMEEERRKAGIGLRALAARVLAEEPSDDLRDAVLVALGWTTRMEWNGTFWVRPDGKKHTSGTPNPLTSLDAAASAMPAGWTVRLFQAPGGDWHVRLFDPSCMMRWATMDPITEPRARTAAALRAMAAEVGE